jgi:glycosyltransferase involved in cell wall biosynthesis
MLRLGERLGMHWASQRIVISDVIRSLVLDKYQRASVLIPNGVSLPTIPLSSNALKPFDLVPGKYILLVSRLVPEKRHLDLIHAFEQAALAGWKLVLVGAADHPDSYTQAVLDAAARTPDVVCTGFQSGQSLCELYAHAGMFVLPSSHEGLPIALLEALSYGLPCIASDIPANLDVRSPGIDFYPVGDVGSLAARLCAQSTAAHDAAKAGEIQQHVADTYRWSEIARETLHVYGRLMEPVQAPQATVVSGAASRWPE